MAKYLMVRENSWVGLAGYGALFQVATDDDAPGGWVCREISGYDVFSDSEPEPFDKDDEENTRFCRVQDVEEFEDWEEARAAAMAANDTYG